MTDHVHDQELALVERTGRLFGVQTGAGPLDWAQPPDARPLSRAWVRVQEMPLLRHSCAARYTSWEVHVDEGTGVLFCLDLLESMGFELPLTQERAALRNDLRSEFQSLEEWARFGVSSEIATVLIASQQDINLLWALEQVEVTDTADARALIGRSLTEWHEAGWPPRQGLQARAPWSAADAAMLASAGFTLDRADDLRAAGHTTVTDLLQARPPQLPAPADRIIITPPGFTPEAASDPKRRAQWLLVSDSPEHLAVGLEERLYLWRDDLGISVETGPKPVHVEDTWSLWDDGRIVPGLWDGRDHSARNRRERPRSLSRAAIRAVELLHSTPLLPEQVEALAGPAMAALTMRSITMAHAYPTGTDLLNRKGTNNATHARLTRHDYVLPASGSRTNTYSLYECFVRDARPVSLRNPPLELPRARTKVVHDTLDVVRQRYQEACEELDLTELPEPAG
jgi:hypothetical protein